MWDNVEGVSPRPDRIIQDINRLQENLRTVYDADGAMVIGVVDRNGHRRRNGVGRNYWARKENQVALSIEQPGLHPDYQQATQEVHDKESITKNYTMVITVYYSFVTIWMLIVF